MRKLIALGLIVCVVGLSACGRGSSEEVQNDSVSLNQDFVKTVKDAAHKLKDTYTDYIIANTVEAPDGNMEYLDIVHGDSSYTEYSVDSDDNLGTLTWGSSESMTYTMTDWLNSDGKYYMFTTDDAGESLVYSFPDSYTNYVSGRSTLNIDYLLDHAYSIEEYEPAELDLGGGVEEYTTYRFWVGSDCLPDLLGASSYGVYKSIMEEQGAEENVVSLCKYYLEDLQMDLTFSDANVVVGIDQDGILKYMCLEVGGLGTRMYLTKAVVAVRNDNARETPDFSGAVPFSSSLKDLADYVASFGSYEEAMNSLAEGNGQGSDSSDNTDPKENDVEVEPKEDDAN